MLNTLVSPMTWILFLGGAGLGMVAIGWRRSTWRRLGYGSIAAALGLFLLLSLRPVANCLIVPLESYATMPSASQLSRVHVMVILGGGVRSTGGPEGLPEPSAATYARTVAGARFFKESSAQVLVLQGAGDGGRGPTNAQVMQVLALSLGVPSDRIVLEERSRNTREHARELARLYPPGQGHQIGIVTSALHMLRSLQAFQKEYSAGALIPIPVDYQAFSLSDDLTYWFPSVDAFSMSGRAIHEWAGLLWYSVRP